MFQMENSKITAFIREVFSTDKPISLHEPTFGKTDVSAVEAAVKSTFVSSVGPEVDRFGSLVKEFTGSQGAIPVTNGTSALHVALTAAGIGSGDLVITQALSFVATGNAILYTGAEPIFCDVNIQTMSLCPVKLRFFLEKNAKLIDGSCHLKACNRTIKAILPMHTFGHPALIDDLGSVCVDWNLILIEDAAESLGSYYKTAHTGTFGRMSAISFNGNKVITTGGGGCVLTMCKDDHDTVKHLTSTAKVNSKYEFEHDMLGYNYRMPNINAALGCAQIVKLPSLISQKRALAKLYENFFKGSYVKFVAEPPNCRSNYWLNTILMPSKLKKDQLIQYANSKGVNVRPAWVPLNRLKYFNGFLSEELDCTNYLYDRIVNLPSSPKEEYFA